MTHEWSSTQAFGKIFILPRVSTTPLSKGWGVLEGRKRQPTLQLLPLIQFGWTAVVLVADVMLLLISPLTESYGDPGP